MNVTKAMKTRPAREPLDTLAACVRDFQWRRAPGGGMDIFADDIPAMCAAAKDFPSAVWTACASRRASGKMHSHQTKVKIEARREFGWVIICEVGPLVDNFVVRGSFDAFFDKLWDLKPAGIGPLTCYDVAVRVGAYLKLEPTQIYLHTGARLGWEAMIGYPVAGPFPGLPFRVPRSAWPLPLRALTADMAEDFLCTYREVLGSIARDAEGRPV